MRRMKSSWESVICCFKCFCVDLDSSLQEISLAKADLRAKGVTVD